MTLVLVSKHLSDGAAIGMDKPNKPFLFFPKLLLTLVSVIAIERKQGPVCVGLGRCWVGTVTRVTGSRWHILGEA